MTRTCPAGHPWTEATTYRRARDGCTICRPCRNAQQRDRYLRHHPGWRPRAWLQQAILAALRAHPEGLRTRRLLAVMGYWSTVNSVQRTVGLLRQRGVPIVGTRMGNSVVYRLEEAA